MIDECPILRLREVDKKFECELTEPNSMQIVRIEKKNTQFTESYKKILSIYGRLIWLASSTNERDEKEFKKALNSLSTETGKILKKIFKDLGINTDKEATLAFALDDKTVKIPWELAYVSQKSKKDSKMMLCQKLSIGRLRVVTAPRWYASSDRRRTNKALVVGTNYTESELKLKPLDYAENEAQKVASILASHGFKNTKLLLGKNATWEKVIKRLQEGVDVFHFTGHGIMSRNSSRIYLNDREFSAKSFGEEIDAATAPGLAFFNACESSVDTPSKKKPTWVPYSWAYAFADHGGKVFIGTLWSVQEPYAGHFAQKFYKVFFGKKRNNLADAMKEARLETSKEETESNATWTGYTLYGIPTITKKDIMR